VGLERRAAGGKSLSLTLRLILLALLASVPALTIQIWNEYDLRRARLAQIHDEVLRLARSEAAEIDRIIEGARQFLVALALIPQVRNKDAAACVELLSGISSNYQAYRALIVADRDGSVFCSSIGPGPPIVDRAYFRAAIETGRFAVGEYVMGRGTGSAAIHFSFPLRDEGGSISGVIAAALNLDWFADRLREKLPANASLNVADRNGTIIVRIPRNEVWRGQPVPERFRWIIYSPEPSVTQVVGLDGLRQILGYIPIPASESGLHVGVARDWDAAFADLNRASQRALILIGLGLTLTFLIVWFFGEYGMKRPIANLLSLVESWRSGHYASSGMLWGRSELGRLGKAFDELAQTVRDREDKLLESETRLKERERYLSVVLDRVPAGIMQTAPDGRYLFVNRGFCQLTGRSREELIGLQFDAITHPDDIPKNVDLFARATSAGQPYSLRKRYIRPDGSIVWTEVTVTRLDDPEEGVLAIAVDLTERLHAEEQQVLLVNELNHRVKNTLTTVQALVYMTKRYSSSMDGFYAAFSERLKALSSTHNLLTTGLWEHVLLHDLVGSELQPYGGGGSTRVTVRGEAVKLKPQDAIALGMVFHELATNAAKYGALAVPAGRVQVSWSIFQDNGSRHLALEWSEQDGPPAKEPMSKGFGSRLIEETIQSLRGKLETHFTHSGFRCAIRFPLVETPAN
jgi:PAS domain S-box-containing protein